MRWTVSAIHSLFVVLMFIYLSLIVPFPMAMSYDDGQSNQFVTRNGRNKEKTSRQEASFALGVFHNSINLILSFCEITRDQTFDMPIRQRCTTCRPSWWSYSVTRIFSLFPFSTREICLNTAHAHRSYVSVLLLPLAARTSSTFS